MNGKDLMESMGYVDEKYIMEAEAMPKRRIHWQSLTVAAAACLVLVLAAGWKLMEKPKMQTEKSAPMVMASGASRSADLVEAVAETNAVMEKASIFAEMTVRIVEEREDGLLCQVVDPGTSDFMKDDQVTIVLPKSADQKDSGQIAAFSLEEPLFQVVFLPDQEGNTITAQQWSKAGE